jgi:hypothetical protein
MLLIHYLFIVACVFQAVYAATLLGLNGNPSGGIDLKGLSFTIDKDTTNNEHGLTKISGKGLLVEVDRLDFRTNYGFLSFLPNSLEFYRSKDHRWATILNDERIEYRKNNILLLQQTASERSNRYEWQFYGTGSFRDIYLDFTSYGVGRKDVAVAGGATVGNEEGALSPLKKVMQSFCIIERKALGRDSSMCSRPEFLSVHYSLIQIFEYIGKVQTSFYDSYTTAYEKLDERTKRMSDDNSMKVSVKPGEAFMTEKDYYLHSNNTQQAHQQRVALLNESIGFLFGMNSENSKKYDGMFLFYNQSVEALSLRLDNQSASLETRIKESIQKDQLSLHQQYLTVLEENITTIRQSFEQSESQWNSSLLTLEESLRDLLLSSTQQLLSSELQTLNRSLDTRFNEERNNASFSLIEARRDLEEMISANFSLFTKAMIVPLQHQTKDLLNTHFSALNSSFFALSDQFSSFSSQKLPSLDNDITQLAIALTAVNQTLENQLSLLSHELSAQRSDFSSNLSTIESHWNSSLLALQEDFLYFQQNIFQLSLYNLTSNWKDAFTSHINTTNEVINNISIALAHSNSIFARVINEVNTTLQAKINSFINQQFLPFQLEIRNNLTSTSQFLEEKMNDSLLRLSNDLEVIHQESFRNLTIYQQEVENDRKEDKLSWNSTFSMFDLATKELFSDFFQQITSLQDRMAEKSTEYDNLFQVERSYTNKSLQQLRSETGDWINALNDSLSLQLHQAYQDLKADLTLQNESQTEQFQQLSQQYDDLSQTLQTNQNENQDTFSSLKTSLLSYIQEINETTHFNHLRDHNRLLLSVALLNITQQDNHQVLNNSLQDLVNQLFSLSMSTNESFLLSNQSSEARIVELRNQINDLNDSLTTDYLTGDQRLADWVERRFTTMEDSHQERTNNLALALAQINNDVILNSRVIETSLQRNISFIEETIKAVISDLSSQQQNDHLLLSNRFNDYRMETNTSFTQLSDNLTNINHQIENVSLNLSKDLLDLRIQSYDNLTTLSSVLETKHEKLSKDFHFFEKNIYQINMKEFTNQLVTMNDSHSETFSTIQQQLQNHLSLQSNLKKNLTNDLEIINSEFFTKNSQLFHQIISVNSSLTALSQDLSVNLSSSMTTLTEQLKTQKDQLSSLIDHQIASLSSSYQSDFNRFSSQVSSDIAFINETVFSQGVAMDRSIAIVNVTMMNQQLDFEDSFQRKINHSLEKQQILIEKNYELFSNQLQNEKESRLLAQGQQEKAMKLMKEEIQMKLSTLENDRLSPLSSAMDALTSDFSSIKSEQLLQSYQLNILNNQSEEIKQENLNLKEKNDNFSNKLHFLEKEQSFFSSSIANQFSYLSNHIFNRTENKLEHLSSEITVFSRDLSSSLTSIDRLNDRYQIMSDRLDKDLSSRLVSMENQFSQHRNDLSLQLQSFLSLQRYQEDSQQLSLKYENALMQIKEISNSGQLSQSETKNLFQLYKDSFQNQLQQCQTQYHDLLSKITQLEQKAEVNDKLIQFFTDRKVLPSSTSIDDGSSTQSNSNDAKVIDMYEKEQIRLNAIIEKQQNQIQVLLDDNKSIKESFVSKEEYDKLANKVDVIQNQMLSQFLLLINKPSASNP